MRKAVTFEQIGDFSKTKKYLKRIHNIDFQRMLQAYARRGVTALMNATPKDTGLTASMWNFKIEITNEKIIINFTNSNVVNGIPIAMLIEFGHATRNGGFVEGINYINPTLEPIFKEMSEEIWREVTM